MVPPVEIYDEYKDMDPSERSAYMSKILSQFEERMVDNNTRILSRVLDLIAETEGDDKLHLDMLATHLAKETSEVIDVVNWPGDDGEWSDITRLSDFMPQTGSGSETGVCPWGHNAKGQGFTNNQAVESLQALEEAVRRNASRELLGSAAESVELPAEYCEFYKHTAGVFYENWDRHTFVCDFSRWFRGVDRQAQPLEKMCQFGETSGFEVAAGWMAGDNDRNCWIYYLLCQENEEPDEPWQWRIFVNNIENLDGGYFDSLNEFLGWYSDGYEWVNWKAVERDIGQLHRKCRERLTRE